MIWYTYMNNLTHTADNLFVRVKYVYRPKILSILFMLLVLKSVKKVLMNS